MLILPADVGAFKENAYQSSNQDDTKNLARRAVMDRHPNLYVTKGQCTLTKVEYQPWWAVDLWGDVIVHAIRITARGDCCGKL
jgi:hypothetical protein